MKNRIIIAGVIAILAMIALSSTQVSAKTETIRPLTSCVSGVVSDCEAFKRAWLVVEAIFSIQSGIIMPSQPPVIVDKEKGITYVTRLLFVNQENIGTGFQGWRSFTNSELAAKFGADYAEAIPATRGEWIKMLEVVGWRLQKGQPLNNYGEYYEWRNTNPFEPPCPPPTAPPPALESWVKAHQPVVVDPPAQVNLQPSHNGQQILDIVYASWIPATAFLFILALAGMKLGLIRI